MNIQVIAEHSVDMDLLPKHASILDAGCRGMLFTNHMQNLGHRVIAMDVDELQTQGYLKIALGGKMSRVGVHRTNDPQATTICVGDEVACWDLKMVCQYAQVKFFDLIKLDIEGSEYEVIMSMDRPYAKQLSIEFHLHTGVYGQTEMLHMENKLKNLGYFPVKHEQTRQHGLSYNFWDSLWVLK